MLNFLNHPSFEKEAAVLQRRFPKFTDGYESFKRICEVHFHPINPKQVIAPGKIHRVKDFENHTLWKVELVVKNLRSSQFPRIWFAVKGSTLVFLCARTHIDNYNNNEVDRITESRVTDIF